MGKKELPVIKVCVIGSEGVGKYSLSQQYAKGWIEPKETNNAPNANCPTKEVELKGKRYTVQLKVCKELDDSELNDCHGIVLMFSVTDKSSFSWAMTEIEKLPEKFRNQTKENRIPNQNGDSSVQGTDPKPEKPSDGSSDPIPVILVGNKVDDAKLSREVETESAQSLSDKFSCAGFFETAAPCNAEVPKAFNCLLTEIVDNMEDTEETVKPSNACCVIV